MSKKTKVSKMAAPWKQWCRLCATKDLHTPKNNIENIIKTDDIEDGQIAEILKRFFGIKLEQQSGQESERLCLNCKQRLKDLYSFVLHVDRVQAMYSDLMSMEKTKKKKKNWAEVLKKFDFIACDEEAGFEVDRTISTIDNIADDEHPLPMNESDIIDAKPQLDSLKIEENASSSIKQEENSSNAEDSKSDNYNEDSVSEESYKTKKHCKKSIRTRTRKLKQSGKQTDRKSSSSEPKPEHVCTQCKLGYMSFSRYRRHMQLKHKKDIMPLHQCTQCTCRFTTALKLEGHIKTHLPLDDKKTYECSDCAKKFTTPYVLENHISAVHNNAKPYICEECGMALKSASSLKTHMMTHSDERPHKCDICEKSFKHYPALKRHKEAHGSQKFVCTTCGFEVNTRSSLKRHMIMHLDVKLFKCEFCTQQFKRAEGYKHHLLLHTGLKPYICNFCNRSFAHGSNCRSHLKKSHPQELAELKQTSGESTAFTNNVPKMQQLKAIIKNANNIQYVHSKKINFSNKSSSDLKGKKEDNMEEELLFRKS